MTKPILLNQLERFFPKICNLTPSPPALSIDPRQFPCNQTQESTFFRMISDFLSLVTIFVTLIWNCGYGHIYLRNPSSKTSFFVLCICLNINLTTKVLKTLRAVYRSSRPEVFSKKGVLKNFTKFTGKHLCQNLFFNRVAGLRPVTLLKKRLWHRSLPVNFL